MLVWVKDLALIWANLLGPSIPWGNAEDAFLVADTRKSSSCLPLFEGPDSIEECKDGSSTLRFHYSEEDSARNLRACRTMRYSLTSSGIYSILSSNWKSSSTISFYALPVFWPTKISFKRTARRQIPSS